MNQLQSSLFTRVCDFFFPGGEDAARRVTAVRITERGEMQSAPHAKPTSFTSVMEIDARRSRFRWDARFRGGIFRVTDAYEDGRGFLALRAGILPVKKMTGPDFDRGELQRYLASLALCPPMLLCHPSLAWTPGISDLRLTDSSDPTGAAMNFEFSEDGRPVRVHAERPRALGNRTVMTPWSGCCSEFRDWDGIRVPHRTEAWWHPPEGSFRYYWSDITAFTALI